MQNRLSKRPLAAVVLNSPVVLLRPLLLALFRLLPATRLYRAKALLLRCLHPNVDRDAMFTSTVKLVGAYRLVVGPRAYFGHDVFIGGGDSTIRVDADVDIGPRVIINSGTHELDMTGPRSAGTGRSEDVHIGRGAWVGAGATILAGVTIGEKAIVAAGSVVTSDLPPYSLNAGVPCRTKKLWDAEQGDWTPFEQEARSAAA